MKNLFILATLLFSLDSFASGKMEMACITEYPTTSFLIREVNSTVIVEVFHHNGPKYMPIFDGVATPNDVSLLAQKASVLTSLPTILRFEWPRSKCAIQNGLIMNCLGSTEAQDINGHKVKAWSFHSSETVDTSFAGKYLSYKLALDLDIDGQSYSVPMKYQEAECAPDVRLASKIRGL
ncbi:hypothetical protein [Bdellovibrio bacteriovorus]|uniref:hypothetical protein n=1 Tax=Bdellovibrio bacteriovorus TaxID=959 RepID=UPI0035A5F7B3